MVTSTDAGRAGDQTRARLLAAARDLFLEGGAATFSLREVARRVGVSPAAIYRHFEDKDALLADACTEGFHVFASYLVKALGESTPRERLVATGAQYQRFGTENPQDYRFIFMGPAAEIGKGKAPHVEGRSGAPQSTTFRFLVDRVSECMSAGVLTEDDPEKVAMSIWAHVHGLVSLRLSGHLAALDEKAFLALYRESVDGLLRGFGD